MFEVKGFVCARFSQSGEEYVVNFSTCGMLWCGWVLLVMMTCVIIVHPISWRLTSFSFCYVTPVCGQMLDPENPYSGYQTEYKRPDADLDLSLDEPVIAPNPRGGPEQVLSFHPTSWLIKTGVQIMVGLSVLNPLRAYLISFATKTIRIFLCCVTSSQVPCFLPHAGLLEHRRQHRYSHNNKLVQQRDHGKRGILLDGSQQLW